MACLDSILSAVPATILAAAAWRSAAKGARHTVTSNGNSVGEIVEKISNLQDQNKRERDAT